MTTEPTQSTPLAAGGPTNPGPVTFATPLGTETYSSRTALRDQITKQMLKGAGIAAAVFFIPVLFIVALWLLGLLLPEASKQAPDPSLETTRAPAAMVIDAA